MSDPNIVEIEDKVAIVTGGANGIGYACVYSLLQRGALYVAIFDNTADSVWVDDLEAIFGKHKIEVYHCDVSIDEEFKANYAKVVEKHKYVDILINNAGVGNEKDAARLLDVNVKGTILANLTAIEFMGKHKGGKGGVIVNVASIIGLLDCHVLPIYSASKHAIVSFTRSMKENCARLGIKILAICPGHTHTKFNLELAEKYSENYLEFVSKESIKEFNTFRVQSPDNVSEAIMDQITTEETGTVMVVENDEPSFKISSPDDYTRKIINNHEAKIFFCW